MCRAQSVVSGSTLRIGSRAFQELYVVVDETDFAEANTLFGHLGVKVVTSHRFLGGHIGLSKGLQELIRGRKGCAVEGLCCQNCQCCTFTARQDAYVALTKFLACEWDYLQRVVPECGPAFEPVEESLRETFLPSLSVADPGGGGAGTRAPPCRQKKKKKKKKRRRRRKRKKIGPGIRQVRPPQHDV